MHSAEKEVSLLELQQSNIRKLELTREVEGKQLKIRFPYIQCWLVARITSITKFS